MKKLNKNIVQYILFGVCLIGEIYWLFHNLYGVYLFTVDYEKDMFIFCLITVIHAVILICISIGSIVGIKKGCRRVLLSEFFIKLCATCICLSVQYIFMDVYERVFIFSFAGVALVFCTYAVLNDKKYSKRYLYLLLCLTAEIFWFIYWLLEFAFVRDNTIIILLVHAIIFIAVSCVSIAMLKKDMGGVIGKSILLKMCLTCFGLSALYIVFNIYAAVIFFAVLGIVFLLVLLAVSNIGKTKNKVIKPVDTIKRFTSDKAKWAWDDAALEYCRVLGKTVEELTDDEKTKIFDYAAMPTSYFLAWLVKRDFVSGKFKTLVGEDYINKVAEEKISPLELFGCVDYVLSREDISENALKFVDFYFENYSYTRIYNYMYDYYETVRNDNKTYYLTEFSWDKYHILEDKINRAYENLNSNSGEGEIEFGKCFYKLFNTEFDIVTDNDVSQEYVSRCIEHINNADEKFINELCDKIINWIFGDSFTEIPDEVKHDKRKILEYVRPTDVYIYVPKNDYVGYVINGECDFEEEHGISWTVRNDEIIFLGCIGDVDSPWSENGEREYKKLKAVKRINPQSVDTVEKAKKLVQSGDLQAVERIPENVGDDNIVFVPEVIAEWKQQNDIMTELMRIRHDADEYFCEPRYKENSIIPCMMTVSAMKGGQIVFYECIEIW